MNSQAKSAPRLPDDDDALITGKVVDATFGGQSTVTRWRRIKAGIIPAPIKLPGSHLNYWRAGTIRRALAQHAGQVA
jgi:predicted DNA-binding transcriptional regulator AlpA